tara:strand:+ start:720 stop:1088 length:369 start_codon:yes stop_codon:yes gene_type:complete
MSTLEVSNLNDGTTTLATTYVTNGSAKVWCNTNQVGTMTVQDSFNVSSIQDQGAGFNLHNFTSALTNNTYSTTACSEYNTMQGINTASGSSTSSSMGVVCMNSAGSYEDRDDTCIQIQGDLA